MAKGKPGAYGQRKAQQSTDDTPTFNWSQRTARPSRNSKKPA